jgi:hypothetical protein
MARFYLGNLKKLDSHDESADRPNTLCFHNMATAIFWMATALGCALGLSTGNLLTSDRASGAALIALYNQLCARS